MTKTDDTGAVAAPKPGMRGWVRAVFIVSLALNLVVLGVVAGGVIGHAKHPPRHRVSSISMGPFTASLSREDREALRRDAEAEGQDFRAMQRAARADYARLIAALRADPWNKAEVQAVLDGHRMRTLERIEIGGRLMFGRIAAMTPDERKAFADRLDRGRHQDRPKPTTGEP
ncbi:periplasmic heavy metal sensor [Phaeovulum sp.]|uniref:periplasmic heavy metal sensor n=1 Tax=Phaeovulum sp. TaxID=2934796 RepID=UPI0039E3D84E